MCFFSYLDLSDVNGMIFFNHLIDHFLDKFFLKHGHCHWSLPLYKSLYYFLNYVLHGLQHLFHCLHVSGLGSGHFNDLQLFLNDDVVFSRDLHWSVLFVDDFHLGRHFYCFASLYNLVDGNFVVLSVYYCLFDGIYSLDWNLFNHFDWDLMFYGHSHFIMHHLSLVKWHHFSRSFFNHIFLRNGNDRVDYFLYVFGDFDHFGD